MSSHKATDVNSSLNAVVSNTSVDDHEDGLSEEERRKILRPKVEVGQALEILRCSYCRSDEERASCRVIKELDSYDDNNFCVSIGGVRFLLKVHNGVESENYVASPRNCVVRLQNDVFRELERRGVPSSVPVPPVATSEDVVVVVDDDESPPLLCLRELPVVSAARSPRRLAARLLRWVEGAPMADAETLAPETLAEAGAFLGRVREALDGLESVGGEWYHAWDGKNTRDLRRYLDCVDDDDRRSLAASVTDAFEREVSPRENEFRTGVLMADFNDANILMRNGRVAGVVDFGDTVRSWTVLDITVAMAYAMITVYGKTGYSVSAAAAMLRGFHSVYPLTPLERRHLRTLAACRLTCSCVLGAYSYKENPSNEYLLLHAQPAWDALALLWRRSDGDRVDALFARACDANPVASDDGTIDCSDLVVADADLLLVENKDDDGGGE